MAKIFIDNIEYEITNDKKNLLDACLSLGLDLPYFCWHPAMGSVGACRQCAVTKHKDEKDDQGKITMACMEPVADGTRISLNHPEAKEMRQGVIEWLMTNHPHDCPVCDEGGECHLQDMTLMTGHNYRRHRFKKRTFTNQYLGPFINHEMNRCITCYRCVRFYRDFAGGNDFNAFAVHNNVYFGRHEDGILENEFSGNLIEVCPTGVFTDKTLKQHYTRKWDLTNAPSICHHCGLGCNTIAAERYGSLRRILSRYNGEVNGYFLCDRGRFGYEFINHQKRIKNVLIKKDGNFEESNSLTAIRKLKDLFAEGKKIIGIGSPRASLEANYSLMKLVGKDNFYQGISKKEKELISLQINILKNGPVRTPSLREIEKKDAVFVLGEDLINTAPMMALALQQSVRQKPFEKADKLNIPRWHDAAVRELIQEEKGALFIATPSATKLDRIASKTFRFSPDDIARLGFTVATIIDNSSPQVENLSDEEKKYAENIAKNLLESSQPLIIAGPSLSSRSIIEAAANIAFALQAKGKNASLSFTAPECNSYGLEMLGGEDLNDALDHLNKGDIDSAIIIENDLFKRINNDELENSLKKLKNIISFDYLQNQVTERSDVVIPIGAFAETDGTLVNNEGRAQRFYQVYPTLEPVKETWRWIRDIAVEIGKDEFLNLNSFQDFAEQLVNEFPQFEGIQNLAPPPGYRIAGQKIPRQPHRFSGRTAMKANVNIHEQKPPADVDSALNYSMEGFRGESPSSIIPFFWSPGWNSAQAINKYQIEVGGPLHDGDPGKRLIEPSEKNGINFYKNIPESFKEKDGEYLIVPLYHIFGSEELSSLSPSVAERIPKPYITINQKELEKNNLKDNDEINFTISSRTYKLKVKISNEMPSGLAGLSNLSELNFVELPSFGKIGGAA